MKRLNEIFEPHDVNAIRRALELVGQVDRNETVPLLDKARLGLTARRAKEKIESAGGYATLDPDEIMAVAAVFSHIFRTEHGEAQTGARDILSKLMALWADHHRVTPDEPMLIALVVGIAAPPGAVEALIATLQRTKDVD